jgi:4-amino-4-deoxy-L-arabinose transferase-like glycosyltransferase
MILAVMAYGQSRRGKVLLSTWWLIPFILFSLAATKRHTYVLIFAPAIFILVSHYWFFLLGKI